MRTLKIQAMYYYGGFEGTRLVCENEYVGGSKYWRSVNGAARCCAYCTTTDLREHERYGTRAMTSTQDETTKV